MILLEIMVQSMATYWKSLLVGGLGTSKYKEWCFVLLQKTEKSLEPILNYTALQEKKLKYTIDEYDYLLCFFLAAGFEFDNHFFSCTSRLGCTGNGNFCISIEN